MRRGRREQRGYGRSEIGGRPPNIRQSREETERTKLFSAIRDLFVLVVAIVIVIATIAALAGLFVGIVILVARSVGG